ncbi:MAG: ArsR family transcriptional regulator [Rhodoglobus sp.]|nr:ArsR family transcriptional regulator [Rhodoglobus sp.]
MSNQSAERAFDALGDPMRRRIIERLSDGPRPVGELADALPIGRPAVSKHLRVLTNAGLVEYTPRGTRNLYALAPEGQRHLQQWLISMWDDTLQSFATYVDSVEKEQP